jgi:hypothetical protein
MMRPVIFVVIVALLVVIAAIASGLLRVRTSPSGDVAARAAPSSPFEVETGSAHVGSHAQAAKTPDVHTDPADNGASSEVEAKQANRD